MRYVLKDAQRKREFAEQGYTVLPQFLDDREITQILQVYRSSDERSLNHVQARGVAARGQAQQASAAGAQVVAGRLTAVAAGAFEEHFEEYRLGAAAFIVKKPGQAVLIPHQDTSMVDESRCRSQIVWVPLVDTNLDNGALGVMPGSHRFFCDVRISPLGLGRKLLPFANCARDLLPYMTFLSIKAGDAIVLDSALIHASLPNLTGEERITAVYGVCNQEEEIYCYYLLPGEGPKKVEAFRVDVEFLYDYDQARLAELYRQRGRPEGYASVGVSDYFPTSMTRPEMAALLASKGIVYNPSLAERGRAFSDKVESLVPPDSPAERPTASTPLKLTTLDRFMRFAKLRS